MKASRARRLIIGVVGLGAALVLALAVPPATRRLEFPGGKRFALTIIDDTDQTTLQRAKPIYDVIAAAGMRTTKTVWVLSQSAEPVATNRGDTLGDPDYAAFISDLQAKGFEIGLHGVRGGSSPRADIQKGIEQFKATLGVYPKLHVNHALNQDNLYWGEHRWTFAPFRWAFGLTRGLEFSGHLPNSPYYWGDIAQQHIRYVERFTFSDINTAKVNPTTPYRIAGMPQVNFWFDTADGGSINEFDALLQPSQLDALEREGGVCLIYAHLGAGSFNVNGDGPPHPRFVARIAEVSSRNGWFAPASEILDYLAAQPGATTELSFRERLRLEVVFLLERVF